MSALQHETTADAVARRRWLSLAAWAGIVGPILFTVAFLAQQLARRDEYDPMAETVSALEAGPYGWVQQLNFVVLGMLTFVFAVGMHRAVRQTRGGIAGPALLALSGVGAMISALFPLREDAAGVTYDPGGHLVGGMTFFLCSGLGLILLSRRLHRDDAWRSLARYTLSAGIAVVASFPIMSFLVIPDDAPMHDWAGLAQRVVVLLFLFPCRIALSIRLLHVAHTSSATRQSRRA